MKLLIVTDEGTQAVVTEQMAPEVFEAFKAWRRAPAHSSKESHRWATVLDAASEWLQEDGTEMDGDAVDSVTEVGTGTGK